MKKILFILMMLVTCLAGTLQAQETITIGTGTSTTYYPLPGFWGWQYDVYVYTPTAAEELDESFNITQIAYDITSNNSGTGATMTIWIKDVDASFTLASSNTFSSLISDATQVYTNTNFTSTTGWNTYELSESFTHEGGNAILIAVLGTGCTTSGGCSRNCHYTSATGTHWYKHSDSSDPGTSATGTIDGNRSNIQFTIEPVGVTCPKPNTITVSGITTNEATVTWTDESATGSYMVQYKTQAQSWEDEDVVTDYTSALQMGLSGLSAATKYNVRVASVCGDETSTWRSASFLTECDIVTDLPFNEGFEDAWVEVQDFGQNNTAPNCWTVYNGGVTSTSYQWKWSQGSTAHTGSKAAQCYTDYANDNGGHHNDWLISPQILLSGSQMLSFYAQRSSSTSTEPDEISIWISDEDIELTAPQDSSAALPGFTQLAQYDLPVGAWQMYEVPLDEYSGNRYIAFVRRNAPNNGFYLRLDDVKIDEMPACTRPANLTEENLTTTSVTLTWESSATYFDLYYKAVNDTAYTKVPDIYDTEYELEINAGDKYTWYVIGYCEEDTMPCLHDRTFLTPCNLISSLPKSWGFENPNISGTSSYPLPACWNRLGNANYPYSYSSYAHTGSRSLSSGSNPNNYIAILPQIDVDEFSANELQLRFFARYYSYNGANYARIEIGVMEDPEDTSSFVLVDTVTNLGSLSMNGSSYTEFEIPLADYEGDGSYIAFRFNAQGSSSSYAATIYVDDITLEYIPTCPRPDSLKVTNIAAHSVNVNWVSEETAFNIYYKTSAATEYTLANESPVSETPYTLEDLIAATAYQVYVTSVCEDGTEQAVYPVNFTTLCDVVVAPYSEDFTGFNTAMSPCWDRYSGLASSVFAGGALTSYSGGWYFSSSNVFPLGHPKINIYGTGVKYWLVSPSLDLSQLEEPALMFSLALTDYGNEDPIENPTSQADDKFMVIISTDNGATWSAANATVWDNTDTGDYVYNSISNTGDDIIIPLSAYSDNIIRIAFYGESTESGGDNDLHIANVSVNEMPSCLRPSGLRLSSISANEATVTWTGDEDGAWQVAYDTTGFNPDAEGLTYIEATENSADLQDLTANTTYDVYVRSVCDNGSYSTWSNMLQFKTLCDAYVVTEDNPFVETFNTLTAAAGIPDCWNNEEGTVTTASYKWNYYATGQTGACVRFNSYSASNGQTNMLKTPVLDLTGVSTPMLSFSYKNATGGDFSVYLSTDGGVTYTTALATGMTGVSSWTRQELVLSDLEEAENVVFVFKGTSNYGSGDAYIYLDSVVVGMASGCLRPANLTLTSVSSDEATVTWSNVMEGTTVELYYKEHSATTYTTVSGSELDNNSYQMTGLLPNTQYDVYVAAICDNNDTLTTTVLTFKTPCVTTVVTTADPFQEDFNTLTAGIPDCWNNDEGTVTTASYKWNYYASGQTGACVRFNSYSASNGQTNMLKTPVLDLSGLANPMVSFSYKNPTGGDFSVYLSTDGGATYTTPIATGLIGASAWTEVEYTLSDLEEAESVVIVFKATSNWGTGDAYIYLDNVFVGEAPTCPKPTGLTVTAVTENSVTLSWTAGEESSWDIIYGEPGFDMTDGTTIPATTNPFTVTGLTNTTTYEFYVRANCTTTDQSYWSSSVTTTTSMVAVDLPYSTDFSTADWKLNNGACANKWKIGVPADSTNNALFITNDNSTAAYNISSISVVSAEKLFNMTNADSVNISFDVRSGGETSCDYLKVFLAPESVEFEPSTTSPSTGHYAYNSYTENAVNFADYMTQSTGTASYTYKLNLTQGRLHISVNMPNPAPNAHAKLVFVWKNDGSVGTQPGAIIENVSIEDAEGQPITCNAPTNLHTTSVGVNEAVIAWDQTGEVVNWTVDYKVHSAATWTSVNNVTTQSYALTNLLAETEYDVRVAAVCGENTMSEYTAILTFTTDPDGVNEYLMSTAIYPNPTTGQFTIENSELRIENVEVYDVYGKLIKTVQVEDYKAIVDLTANASGIYFARIYTDKGMVTKQIVKK